MSVSSSSSLPPPPHLFFLVSAQLKQQLKTHEQHHEAMASDVVAQAHLENIALAIFDNADSKDRAGRFDK